jgi:hypothetical protein
MGRSVFLKFQHADEGNGLPEFPGQRYAHLTPALPEVAIRPLSLWDSLWIEREGRHTLQFVFPGDLRDACADFFQFWIAATPTPVRLAEKRCVPELPWLALQWPDCRFVTTSEWFFSFQLSRPFAINLKYSQVK